MERQPQDTTTTSKNCSSFQFSSAPLILFHSFCRKYIPELYHSSSVIKNTSIVLNVIEPPIEFFDKKQFIRDV